MQVVEAIGIYLGLDLKDFNAGADQAISKNQKLESSLEGVERSAHKTATATIQLSEEQKKATQALSELGQVVTGVHKLLTGLFTTIAVSTGFSKLISNAQKSNNELYRLEKQLGMSAGAIAAWQGAAAMAGGSAEGMTSTLQGLSRGINDLVTMGDASLLPFLNALGVGVIDSTGNIRNMDDILLDMSDSFSKMDSQRAYSIGSKMGLDNGTIATLLEGRDALQEMLDLQKSLYTSSAEELKASRELSKQQALLNTQYESLKVMLGNALVPVLIEITKAVNGFFQFLHRNEKTVKNVFGALSFILGAVLIPIIYKAAIAMAALIAPFAPFIVTVAALGAAFIALYDDYKTWAEGGQSLFNWGAFTKYIDDAEFSVDNLKKGFAYLLTGYTDWAKAAEGGRAWMKLKGFIDENGVSVDSLIRGFNNLSKELINDAIPTLKGYASILQKLLSGDFKGAFLEAGQMMRNLVSNEVDRAKSWGDRIAGALDIGTGQQVGTFTQSSGNIMNSDVKVSQDVRSLSLSRVNGPSVANVKTAYTSKDFTPEKARTIAKVARRIGVNPNDLAAVISFETSGTFSPSSKNPRSSATGLIQFMKGSGGTKGKYYGMSRDQFASLSFDEQMNYVERYFKERGFRADTPQDVASTYTAVTGYGYRDIPKYNKKGERIDPYWLNRVWDSDKNGYIEKGEMVKNPSFKKHQRQYFQDSDHGNGIINQDANEQLNNFMNQGNGIKNNTKSIVNNNQKQIDVNIGDINVTTSSNSVSGVMNDALSAANNSVDQLITGIS